MVLIQPEPLENPPEQTVLEARLADLQQQLAVNEANKKKRKLLPFEVQSEAGALAAVADTQQQLADLPAKLAAKAATPKRPYALVLRIGGKVEIWTCTNCGTGVVRVVNASGGVPGQDGRDLHDPFCPAKPIK